MLFYQHKTNTKDESIVTDSHDRMLAAAHAALEASVAAGNTPGAVCAIAAGGTPIGAVASGVRAVVGTDGAPLAEDHRIPTDPSVRYDLASVTKLFTAATVLTLVQRGVIGLDTPVADAVPEFRTGARREITLRRALSHTSGLPAEWPGWHDYVIGEATDAVRWQLPPRDEVLHTILGTELVREPGHGFEYSCLGYITAMAYAETVTGSPWNQLVEQTIAAPLGLTSVAFGAPTELAAPTEWQPTLGRGVVTGVVHDETAFALGGISGNAGLFATADDLLRFGLAMSATALGRDEHGVLGPEASAAFWNDELPHLIASPGWDAATTPDYGQGLGPRIGQASWMTADCSAARGHPGFTGCSLMIDPDRDLAIALMTNRVHPSRWGSDGNAIRAAVTSAVCTEFDRTASAY